jgi:rhodanese-related sulfurtransferase
MRTLNRFARHGLICSVALLGCVLPAVGADQPVGITAEFSYLDVTLDGKTIRIERNPDNFNMVDPDLALTSRACPPYCIQPIVIAPGVETLGELEVLDYIKRIGQGDKSVLLVDSREPDWLGRFGMIPGSISLSWTRLHPQHTAADQIVDTVEDLFGVYRVGPIWNFSHAKTLVLYCNGPWCGQSPTNIRQLLAMGYPAHKIKWYRSGIQGWKLLGLTTVPPRAP